ncbi:hypothetical protein T492DRAFT_951827 [Pavlovales sp. CCMP2436]|nr:hypothetical protein T492DRAFT_951827 [Pavlovales sp. CCMP2436]
MGAHTRTEAGDIFASVLAANQAAYRLYLGGVGRRPGPIVDLYAEYDHKGGRAVPRLLELKTMAFCKTRYRHTDGNYPRPKSRTLAVGRRADSLPVERMAELIKKNRDFYHTTPGQTGPMQARAQTFCTAGGPAFVPLVIGAFGEWSDDLESFVGDLASTGARALQARMGAPSATQARSTHLWKMRQKIGMCTLRGHAKVINIARAQLDRTGTGNGGGTRTDSDDDGNPDEWADEGAYHLRRETRSRIGA